MASGFRAAMPSTLPELIDALVRVAMHGGKPLASPEATQLRELDAKIGSECQVRGIQIPDLGHQIEDRRLVPFGFTKIPVRQTIDGSLMPMPGGNWQQAMRGLKLIAARTPEPAAKLSPKSEPEPAPRADRSPLFPKGVPDDSDLVDLVTRLDAEREPKRSWNKIARELLGESQGNDTRTQSLLRKLRRMRRAGRVNL
jgi:hypothetical protein